MSRNGYDLVVCEPGEKAGLSLLDSVHGEFTIDCYAEGASLGTVERTVAVVDSLITDGNLTRVTKVGNRVATFTVVISAATGKGLAQGQQVLESRLDRLADLLWVQPDAPTTVLRVVRSWSDLTTPPGEEVFGMRRAFAVSFECLPWTYSLDEVEILVEAPWVKVPLATNSTTVAPGWTGGAGLSAVTFSLEDGAVYGIRSPSGTTILVQRTQLIAAPYLWFYGGEVTDLTIDGVAVSTSAESRRVETQAGSYMATTYDVSRWLGHTAVVQFRIDFTGIARMLFLGYPNKLPAGGGQSLPRGVGVVQVPGSRPWEFEAIPVSGANPGRIFVSGPNPTTLMRRGAAEVVFASFTVAGPNPQSFTIGDQTRVFAPGTYRRAIGRTQPRNGAAWPQEASGNGQWAYPSGENVAVSAGPGAGSVVSASPTLPQGIGPTGPATVHANHVARPDRGGMMLFCTDDAGMPVPFRIKGRPAWNGYAAQ